MEQAHTSCISQLKLNSQVAETAGVTTDVAYDPTVGLPDFCSLCGDQLLCASCQNPPGDTTTYGGEEQPPGFCC